MSRDDESRLSTQLARLACDADDLVLRVIRRGKLTETQADMFEPAAAHFALAVDNLQEAIYEARRLDQRDYSEGGDEVAGR